MIRNLVEKGYAVKALYRGAAARYPFWISPNIFEQVEWAEGDVLDVVSLHDAMKGCDTVIHAAAVVSYNRNDRKMMQQVNVDGTANVVNTALDHNIKRMVHLSSIAALGRPVGEELIDEENIWEDNPYSTHYARSKFKAELEVWRGMGEGLNSVILNPCTILGYGNWNSGSCAVFKTVYSGFGWSVPGTNGFVDVEDTANAVLLAMESSITEQRFIICAENWPFLKLQQTIASCFHKERQLKMTTPFLLGLAWRLEKMKSLVSGKKPLLTRESARIAISGTRYNNSKFLHTFPEFRYKSLTETIRQACDTYNAVQNSQGRIQ